MPAPPAAAVVRPDPGSKTVALPAVPPSVGPRIANGATTIAASADVAPLKASAPSIHIPKPLLEAYVRDASKSDEAEHRFLARQLDSQLIFVRPYTWVQAKLISTLNSLQAGIFSAVVVQLIPQTYPMLQVPQPTASAIAINVGLFGSLVTSVCTAILSLQCRTWLDGYEVQ
jgi:hypothetical protein